jgi:hypothetical protein
MLVVLTALSTMVSWLILSTSMAWSASQPACAEVAVTVAVNPYQPTHGHLLEYQITAGHNHGPPTTIDVPRSTLHTYYVVAGETPVLVHNCDSVVLGVNPHSNNLAKSLRDAGEDLQAQTFNRGNYGRLSATKGRPEWMNKVADAIRTPGTRLRVTLDGLPGDTAEEALKNAYTRGMPLQGGNWRTAAAYGNGTAWEIGSLASAVKAGAREWSSVMFYWKGKQIPTPIEPWK